MAVTSVRRTSRFVEQTPSPNHPSGDGGIDGIIKEDKLGLDVVCVQAKRWEGTVGSREIRDFVGGMETYRSRKGVLITTSGFSKDAREYVTQIERRVVLIAGGGWPT